jgi:hypothetical protein
LLHLRAGRYEESSLLQGTTVLHFGWSSMCSRRGAGSRQSRLLVGGPELPTGRWDDDLSGLAEVLVNLYSDFGWEIEEAKG